MVAPVTCEDDWKVAGSFRRRAAVNSEAARSDCSSLLSTSSTHASESKTIQVEERFGSSRSALGTSPTAYGVCRNLTSGEETR